MRASVTGLQYRYEVTNVPKVTSIECFVPMVDIPSDVHQLPSSSTSLALKQGAIEIGLFGWMAIVALVIFGTTGHTNPTEPVFWFMMQIGMTIDNFGGINVQ